MRRCCEAIIGWPRQGRATRAVEYIRNFAAAWAKAKPPTRAMLVQAVYEGVTVRGEEFVSVRLTAEAYAHGLALARGGLGPGHPCARTAS